MKLTTLDSNAEISLSDDTFGRDFNEALVHQLVTTYQAAGHLGTKALKNRAAVSGGGAKPWRQKGTGRARAGTNRSPLWRGGGVTFAATPGTRNRKLNRKMYRAGLRSIFSELARSGRFQVVDRFSVDSPKTRELVGKLRQWSLQSVLIVTEAADKDLYLAARNLPDVDVTEVGGIDPVSLLRADHVLATANAVKRLESWL